MHVVALVFSSADHSLRKAGLQVHLHPIIFIQFGILVTLSLGSVLFDRPMVPLGHYCDFYLSCPCASMKMYGESLCYCFDQFVIFVCIVKFITVSVGEIHYNVLQISDVTFICIPCLPLSMCDLP